MNIEKLAAQSVANNSKDMLLQCMKMLDNHVTDYRDIITNIAIIYDAIKRSNLSPDDFLKQNLVVLKSDQARKEIECFLNRNENDKALKSFGYKFTESPNAEYVFAV
jgi:hypothetical protein